jgi:hypothetical protein
LLGIRGSGEMEEAKEALLQATVSLSGRDRIGVEKRE